MSRLRIFEATGTSAVTAPTSTTEDAAEIAARLASIGVRFEQWRARPLGAGASRDEVLAAYREEVDALVAAGGFQTIDVVAVAPDAPNREAMRAKFLDEHFHEEDEIRFFVAGSGLFTLHVDGRAFEIRCEAGDLIGVPDRMHHWFDMGPAPRFTAIRFFQKPDGWVGHFTGSGAAQRFPRYEPGQAG